MTELEAKNLKPGVKVRCLVSQYGNETVGKIYVVSKDYDLDIGWWFSVESDDRGHMNGYPISNFELVEKRKFHK